MLRSMGNIKGHISDELLAAFLDGSADVHETEMVLHALQEDPALAEVLTLSARVDEVMDSCYQGDSRLPLVEKAALGKDALCDVKCERYILEKFGVECDVKDMIDVAEQNMWLHIISSRPKTDFMSEGWEMQPSKNWSLPLRPAPM